MLIKPRAILFCFGFASFAACTSDPPGNDPDVGTGLGGSGATAGAGGGSGGMSSSTGGAGGAPAPAPEVTVCPAPNTPDVGTNTAVRIHSGDLIDTATVLPDSLRVLVNGLDVPGALEIDPQDLTFLPDKPLPPNQLVEVILSADVLDNKGRSLSQGGGTSAFVTSSDAAPVLGFKFSHPKMAPAGVHAPRHAMVMDGELPVLAWATGGTLVATAFDGAAFPAPTTIVNGYFTEQLTLALGADKAHFGWTYFDGPGTIVYSRADLPFGAPSPAPLGLAPGSYYPRIAADKNGKVALVWSAHTNYWNPWGDRYSTSDDNGETFSPIALLDSDASCADIVYVEGYLVAAYSTYTIAGKQELRVTASPDNGKTFSPPITITTSSMLWCPKVIDNHAGEALVLFDEGPGIGERSSSIVSFTPATSALTPIVQLTPPEEIHGCANVAAAPGGKAVVTYSRGSAFDSNWETVTFESYDGGHTFGSSSPVGVISPMSGCPDLGYAPSGNVYVAWLENDYELMWSRGQPKRPCE